MLLSRGRNIKHIEKLFKKSKLEIWPAYNEWFGASAVGKAVRIKN